MRLSWSDDQLNKPARKTSTKPHGKQDLAYQLSVRFGPDSAGCMRWPFIVFNSLVRIG
jgi:hypothetical protein